MTLVIDMINVGSLLLIAMLIYAMFLYIRAFLTKDDNLNMEQLTLLENTTKYAVNYAEQMYKVDISVDRRRVALDYMYDVVAKANLDFIDLSGIINGLMEAHVLELPKTHE
jgi:hypothetical protein